MRFLAWLVPLFGFAGAVTAQYYAANAAIDRPNDPLYLPDARIARHLDMGLGEAWADWLHIQALLYVVEEFDDRQAEMDAAASEEERQAALRKAKYRWLAQLYDAITELDPKFREAYLYGARFLTLLSKEQDRAIALLERGIQANPGDPELLEELGMIYYIDKKDTESALKWLQAALDAHSPNPMLPGFVARIAEGTSYDQEVGRSLARQMKRYADAGDHRMEAALREKLQEHTARIALRRLTAMVDRLVAGGATKAQLTIETLQQACHATERLPAGFFETAGGFWYDPQTGDVESQTLAPSERSRRTRRLEYLLGMFRSSHDGRLPKDPAELASAVGEAVPHHPLPGWRFEWDPDTGAVREQAP